MEPLLTRGDRIMDNKQRTFSSTMELQEPRQTHNGKVAAHIRKPENKDSPTTPQTSILTVGTLG
jgi:hypothetical protein